LWERIVALSHPVSSPPAADDMHASPLSGDEDGPDNRVVLVVWPVDSVDAELVLNVMQRIRERGRVRSFYVRDSFLYAMMNTCEQVVRAEKRINGRVALQRVTLQCESCAVSDCPDVFPVGGEDEAGRLAADAMHVPRHRAGVKKSAKAKACKGGVRHKNAWKKQWD